MTIVMASRCLLASGLTSFILASSGRHMEQRVEEAVRHLILQLESSDKGIRAKAADQLAELGPAAHRAIPALALALTDQDAGVRVNAAYALIRIGPDAIPYLVKALESDVPEARYVAVWAVDKFGPKAKTAVPSLIKMLGEKKAAVRREVVFALGGIREREAVEPLLKLLQTEKDTSVRIQVVRTFACLGPKAAEAVPTLIDFLDSSKSDDLAMRIEATEALACIGSPAVRGLVEFISNSANDRDDRISALCGLDRMVTVSGRTSAQPAIPMLIEILDDADFSVRLAGVRVLRAMGPDAKRAVPALEKARRDESQTMREAAGEALQEIQRKPKWFGGGGQ